MEAGPSLEGRGLGKKICKEGPKEKLVGSGQGYCGWRKKDIGDGGEGEMKLMGVHEWEIQDWGRWGAINLQLPPGL